jgi:S1-C subfamily serine protease
MSSTPSRIATEESSVSSSILDEATSFVRTAAGDAFLQTLEFGTKSNITHPQRMGDDFGAAGSCVAFEYNEKKDYVLFVSNAHTIADAHRISVRHPAWVGGSVPIVPVGAHIKRDISLLVLHDASKVPGINAELQTVITKWLSRLEPVDIFVNTDTPDIIDSIVIIAGYPLAETDLNLTEGHIGSRSNLGGRDVLKTSGAMNHGNSGGAAMIVQREARSGNLFTEYVGIPSYGKSDTNSTGYIIPASEVSNIISFMLDMPKNRINNRDPSTPFLNVEDPVDGVDMVFQAALGGYRVQRIDTDSPFFAEDESLLQVDDIVVSVNGVSVSGIAGNFQEDFTTQPFTLRNMIDATTFNGRLNFSIKRVKGVPLNALHMLAENAVTELIANTEVTAVSVPWLPNVNLGVRERWDGIEDTSYEMFAGLYLTEFKLQHLRDRAFAARARRLMLRFAQASPQKRKEPVLIVVDVDKSMLATGITPGTIVHEINGERVRSLQDYREALQRIEVGGTVVFGFDASPFVKEPIPFPILLKRGLDISRKVSEQRNVRITEATQLKLDAQLIGEALEYSQQRRHSRINIRTQVTKKDNATKLQERWKCPRCKVDKKSDVVYCSRMCKMVAMAANRGTN